MSESYSEIRNIAIIAHVDHGKTTLIDSILRQSGTFRDNQDVDDRVMDKNDLEKERGITILAKVTSVLHGNTKINIVDTPGHADFGGEVERILGMVDCVVLLVDSAEGPLPQTKFVLSKALKLGIKPIVMINKIDRQDARPDEVHEEVFDLFCTLDADDDQTDFPMLYASGKNGWAVTSLDDPRENLEPLFSLILSHVPKPKVNDSEEFVMLATTLGRDPFLGRMLTGKVYSGNAKINTPVKVLDLDGKEIEKFRLTKLMSYKGIDLIPVEEAAAGDIITIAGMQKASVADTICSLGNSEPIASQPIDPPTISITLSVNTSPFAGKEGSKLTSTMIRDRLLKESETNVAIKVDQQGESFTVSGRGELQLGVLVETMRREGFELSMSRPNVIYQKNEQGKLMEPIEEVVIDVDDEYASTVVSDLSKRKGDMVDMRSGNHGKTRIVYHIPSRGLIGYHGQFLTQTRGTGVLNRLFFEYQLKRDEIDKMRNGALISLENGPVAGYALFNLQDRGIMFVSPGDEVYEGMIVGEHNRSNDLIVNVNKGKKLTNMRASGTDDNIVLSPPRKMTLEQMIPYIQDDELVEITPKSLRLRKLYLTENERKRSGRK